MMAAATSSFAGSFWTKDYVSGINKLQAKLQQGCVENNELVALIKARADAEEQYAARLQETGFDCAPKPQGFGRDEGASLRKAYDGIVGKIADGGRAHAKIALNIRQMALYPFSRWAGEHERRVAQSHDGVLRQARAAEKLRSEVIKLRSAYCNKCRLLDNLNEEEGLAFPEQPAAKPTGAERALNLLRSASSDADDADEAVELGDVEYAPAALAQLLRQMADDIPQADLRVPILGVYHNVSAGDAIVQWLLLSRTARSLAQAEQVGQDLVDAGFLRLIGSVGSTFANSSVLKYQWQKKALALAGRLRPEPARDGGRMTEVLGTLVSSMNSSRPDEPARDRLQREVAEANDRYKSAVRRLDDARCVLEQLVVDHLQAMEHAEAERLQQTKSVLLVFSAAISNVLPSLQATIDGMLLYHETIQPARDLRYILENYRTGAFVPQTEVYESYFMSNEEQTFGVSLELRAREDHKRVPNIVTTVLSYMDGKYPEMDGDTVRQEVWLQDVGLRRVHDLRRLVNTGRPFSPKVLDNYELPVVTGLFKLYLLELRESVVDPKVYEILKAYYASRGPAGPRDGPAEAVVHPLANILGQLPICNIATLDAICSHFTRLLWLTSAPDAFKGRLAQELARLVLRPRVENVMTMEDRHGARLVLDLLEFKDEIFSTLKSAGFHTERQRAMVKARNASPSEGFVPTHAHRASTSSVPIPLVLTPARLRVAPGAAGLARKTPTPPAEAEPAAAAAPAAPATPAPEPAAPATEPEPEHEADTSVDTSAAASDYSAATDATPATAAPSPPADDSDEADFIDEYVTKRSAGSRYGSPHKARRRDDVAAAARRLEGVALVDTPIDN
ncbi:uncharacterized protein V1510DRAFT_393521 [Dipodascopsis tothii]|uniref:uncharacterized protein n=1 Tax=Dipodascopsis tothii TaxID=44089 RepID=UPI0034CD83F6